MKYNGHLTVHANTLEDAYEQMCEHVTRFLGEDRDVTVTNVTAVPDTIDASGPGGHRLLIGYWIVDYSFTWGSVG